MHFATIIRIICFFAIGFSLTLLIPAGISLWYDDGELLHFVVAFVSIFLSGLVLWIFSGRHHTAVLAARDGFLIVALFWSGISLLASLPLALGAHMNFVDALFEAVSAFTTTGATVLSGLDDMPPSILFYRQQLQWLGGMGLVVLAVAVLPMLGVGGMQIYRAETPGPMKEEKLTPRLMQSARFLWIIYFGLTLVCALAYWMAGMNPFDAIAHSLSTVSTGGFSTHDASLGYFNSTKIEAVAVFFMMAGAINFSVHFQVMRKNNPLLYFKDVEVRSFILFVIFMIILISILLRLSGEYHSMSPSLRNAVFEVISVVTSTGFGTVDFSQWPEYLAVLLIFISFVGGCGGSTAGGMKVMRILVLLQQGKREIIKLIHPRAVLPIRIGGRTLNQRIIYAVGGFLSAYIAVFVILMLLMMMTGLDQVSAFSAIATCMNNLGPGLGEVATSFSTVTDSGKIIAVVAMLMGRLEIFTILVLLTPAFWRL